MAYIMRSAFTHVELESIVSFNGQTLTSEPICIIILT